MKFKWIPEMARSDTGTFVLIWFTGDSDWYSIIALGVVIMFVHPDCFWQRVGSYLIGMILGLKNILSFICVIFQ